MSPRPSQNSNPNSRPRLRYAKVAAVVLSFLFAFPVLPVTGEPQLDFVSATFFIALIGLLPNLGATIPCLILGFWLSPMFFAFQVNGSFAQDLTAMIFGGTIGLLIGLVSDVQVHIAASKVANRNLIGSLPE